MNGPSMIARVAVRGLAAAACALGTWAAGPVHAATHLVTIEAMAFSPPTLTVKRGDTVVWHNKDLVPHTATAAGHFDSGNIAADKRWSRVMKTGGRFAYVCTYHPGMKAEVVVQ